MKKQANLTLETAKEFYKQGGAARKFALDNYSKDELVEPNWPKSWRSDDFCFLPQFLMNTDKYEDVRSMQAYWNLRRMAEQMNDGWEPDWENGGSKKWIVTLERGCLTVYVAWVNKHLISFKAEKMAEFSLKHHKELWEQYYQINP